MLLVRILTVSCSIQKQYSIIVFPNIILWLCCSCYVSSRNQIKSSQLSYVLETLSQQAKDLLNNS